MTFPIKLSVKTQLKKNRVISMTEILTKTDIEQLSSEELLDIWNSNDRGRYKREAFVVILEILKERGIDPPQQSLASLVRSVQGQDTDNSSITDYFSFKTLISTSLIQVSYLAVMIMITGAGCFIMYKGNALIGAAILIFGNLLWRIVCEGSIILFGIHDSLVSIDKKL